MKLAEHNLRVAHYLNGDPIRHAQSAEDWFDAGENKEGAYCVSPTGGYLYNWYAVNDPRGLCRVPTDSEWDQVRDIDSLRVYDGLRNSHGSFASQGGLAYFWSSSEGSLDYAWYRLLSRISSALNRKYFNKRNGFSVRCIKEE